jgi:hypothetical protein
VVQRERENREGVLRERWRGAAAMSATTAGRYELARFFFADGK